MISADPFELVFTRRYSMAHRLIAGCSEKCRTPHGHNEFVTINLAALDSTGLLDGRTNMIETFEKAKKLWHKWIDQAVDHAFQLNDQDPMIEWFAYNDPMMLKRLLITPGDPTTEMLAVCFKSKLEAFMRFEGSRLRCVGVSIEETPTNRVTFRGAADVHLPSDVAWYNRSDLSINDFN